MINNENILLIKSHLEEYKTYNIRFNYKGVQITLSFNNLLHSNSNYIMHCTNEAKVYINLLKYTESFLDFSKNFLDYKFDKETREFFLSKFLFEGKLDLFWKTINEEMQKGNYFEQDLIPTFSLNSYSKNKGIYLCNKINKKMSEVHFKYLQEFFNISKKKLRKLQKSGLTIATTNDINKSLKFIGEHRQYYNNDFE